MEEAPSPAPALWNSDYLDHCFADHRVCISFGLWICACCCWIAAHALLLYLMCAKRSGQAQSALCAACCLLTSLCDTVGAILARQLTIQSVAPSSSLIWITGPRRGRGGSGSGPAYLS
ncbi:transmembrane protein 44 [Phyllostomus discolor]|uniref:Transmembrane protein 44 n=1 Tax=Phyllostomus discolor TaxID=89673 RepID=A0A834B2M7_9CHIR|nr:transmembrane protein 44 [Phyllostomus discolor]